MKTFIKTDHILGHKTHHNTFKRIEITQRIFSDHDGMKLELRKRKRGGKSPNSWRLNNALLNNMCQLIKKCFELNETTTYQNL